MDVTLSELGLPVRLLGRVGASARAFGWRQVDRISFLGAVLRTTLRAPAAARRIRLRMLVEQLRRITVEGLGLVCLIGALTGAAATVEAHSAGQAVGMSDTLGTIATGLFFGQLAPLLTTMLVAARSGTRIAAELLTARVLGETDALEAVGVEPIGLYALPRILALALAVVVLIFYFEAAALLGAMVAGSRLAIHSPLSSAVMLRQAITPLDVALLAPKGLLLGGAVGVVCTYEGLRGGRQAEDLPRALTRAVVASLSVVVAAWAIVSLVLLRSH